MADLVSYMRGEHQRRRLLTGDCRRNARQPRLSERAFIQNSLLMLERRYVHGTLARGRR